MPLSDPSPFSIVYTCFSSFKLDSTPSPRRCFLGSSHSLSSFFFFSFFFFLSIWILVLFFYLKLVFFFYSYWRSTLVGKKVGHLVLPVGSRFVSYHIPNVSFFYFLAHCFMFFNQMTIIYLSLESCWYIRFICLFKYLVCLNAWILKHFVLLWFILL